MKIVIAAWHLKDFNVGLGRYSQGLIEAIAGVEGPHQYVILMPEQRQTFPKRAHMRYRVIRLPIFKRRVWEQLAPLTVGSYDLLHFPYDSCVAWKRGKFVSTVHDVKPLIFPRERSGQQERLPREPLIERLLIRDRWNRIDHIITDSSCSRQDILKRLPVSAEKVTVVYPGIDRGCFRPADPEAKRTRDRPFVLCVAGSDPTKNVESLVEAFVSLPLPIRTAYDLVLVGDFRRRPDLREQVAHAGMEKQIVFTGKVEDVELVRLYQHATLFVFPSRYEGFGYPVLEAMACGCPVISSNASSLPEVTGDAAVLVDPMNSRQLAGEMERVLGDRSLRQDLRERGFRRASRFSWKTAAREIVALYDQVGQS
jgi:glycosyltransferase involved in cell wall biosynthesis